MPYSVDSQILRVPPRPSIWVALLVALAAVIFWGVFRLGAIVPDRPLPVSFGLCLVPFLWIRRRALLWLTAAALGAMVFIEKLWVFTASPLEIRVMDLFLLTFNLLLFTGVIHLLVFAVDLIEHRSRQLARSNAELSAVWRTAPAGLCICNADLTDIRLNAYAAAHLGCVADENIASDLRGGRVSLLRDGNRVGVEQLPMFRAVSENVHVEPSEWDLIGPNGRRITVMLAAAPIREADRRDGLLRSRATTVMRVTGAVAAFADISGAKQLQRELDLRRREAEEATVRKTRFLSSVSHDIRSPANAISLLAELLGHAAGNSAMTHEIPKFASDLRASSQKLVDLVSDVLDFTKYDSNRVEIVESAFELSDLIAEEAQQAAVLAGAKGIRVEFEPPSPRISVRTDRVKLGRILGNLLSNAVKFTSDGTVRVSAERNRAGDVLVRVSDTGPGIPAAALSRVFDEFYQVRSNSASRDPSRAGSGLGLAICRRLASAMGMRLEVESTVGVGTVFTVIIPEPITILSHREPPS